MSSSLARAPKQTTSTDMLQNIADAIRINARHTPEKCAVTDGAIDISYSALDGASHRFATRLLEMGCRPGDRVVLLARKQAALMVGLFGALKSRSIYVPLDPAMPAGRLRFLLGDISPRVVVTDPDLLPRVEDNAPPGTATVLTDELRNLLSEDQEGLATDPLPEVHGDDVAYCIYTSGSTGRPKGVLIRHRSVLDFFEGTKEVYDVERDSRCVSFSPFHFDGAVMDALFPLYRGAWLYTYGDVIDPDMLFDVVADHAVTHFAAFGAMLDVIAQASQIDQVPLPKLRTVLTGAHAPDVGSVQKWLQKTAGGKVINAYGPTEATCACVAYVIRRVEPERQEPYPIGKAFKHARLSLIDHEGATIDEPGIQGELLIGGSQVMKGYWHREEENEARLVEMAGGRHYKTGDVCEYLPDGNLLFIGRKDTEVNIGGYRVNLNEVKQVIDSVNGVRGSEVVKTASKHGEPILLAAVVLGGSNGTSRDRDAELLREQLMDELPSYMMPRHLVVMDELPLLSSGKIDRRALTLRLQRKLDPKGATE